MRVDLTRRDGDITSGTGTLSPCRERRIAVLVRARTSGQSLAAVAGQQFDVSKLLLLFFYLNNGTFDNFGVRLEIGGIGTYKWIESVASMGINILKLLDIRDNVRNTRYNVYHS